MPMSPKQHRPEGYRSYDQDRGTAAERGYNRRWQKARVIYLQSNPLCVACMRSGRATPATVIDHVQPHRGDVNLFWDSNNWQSLCKACHDRKTAGGQ